MRLLLLIVILSTLFSCSDDFEHSYSRYSDFQKANLRLKTWFPELIDSTCYDLREIHTIGDIESYGKFSYQQNSEIDSALSDTTSYKPTGRDSLIQFLKRFKDLKPPKWFADETTINNASFFRKESTYFIRDDDHRTIYYAYTSK